MSLKITDVRSEIRYVELGTLRYGEYFRIPTDLAVYQLLESSSYPSLGCSHTQFSDPYNPVVTCCHLTRETQVVPVDVELILK